MSTFLEGNNFLSQEAKTDASAQQRRRAPNARYAAKYDVLKAEGIHSRLSLNNVEFFLVDYARSPGHAITKDGKFLDTPEKQGDPAVVNDPRLNQTTSPALHAIEPVYKDCFPILTEQMELKEAEANLDHNEDETFQKNLPMGCAGSKEAWIYARDKETGEVIGGLNFNAQAGSMVTDKNGARLVDGHSVIIYSFVEKAYRSRDLFTLLLEAHDMASTAFIEKKLGLKKGTGKVLSWCEQTDTGLISAEDHVRDAIHSCTRSDIFERRGFRSIRSVDGTQVIYNQPDTGVANGEDPARIVNRRVRPINCELGTHPRALDKEGIEYFLAASFPEGTSLNAEAHTNMRLSLNRPEPVRLLPPGLYKSLGKVLSPKALQLIADDPSYKDMPLAMVAYKALEKPVADQGHGVESKGFRKTLVAMKGAFEAFYNMPEAGIKAYVAEALSDPQWAPAQRRLHLQQGRKHSSDKPHF